MGGKKFSFWPTSGAACGLGLLSVVLCQRLSGASNLSREGSKAAFVQLVRRERKKKKLLEFGSIYNVRTNQ